MSTKSAKVNATWTFLILLSIAGILLSLHLGYIHFKVYNDPGYISSCGVSDAFNCETVALSGYSVFLGVPFALWGLLLYLMFLGLGWWGSQKEEDEAGILSAGFLLSIVAFCGSLGLAYISHFKIKSLCPSCIGTYLVNTLLFVLMLVSVLKAKVGLGATIGHTVQTATKNLKFFVIPPVLALVLMGAFPKYWVTKISKLDPGIATGKTKHGHSWIGAKNPTLTIVEYADYQCPFCKRAHARMRRFVAKHKDYVRLVHRHYPLDHHCNPNIKRRFHPKACLLAYAAHCASKQKQFWPVNDVLYKHSKRLNPYLLKRLAKRQGLDVKKFTSCINKKDTRISILMDIKEASENGIRGTPSFIVDGQLHLGVIKGLDKMAVAARLKAKQQKAGGKPSARRSAGTPARRAAVKKPVKAAPRTPPAKPASRTQDTKKAPKAKGPTGGVIRKPATR